MAKKTCISVKSVNAFYSKTHALKDVSLDINNNEITALIGPSGCGKSTFLRCINRMNDVIPQFNMSGEVLIDGQNIYDADVDVVQLRAKVGMVFQKANPFPKSIFENVAYGPRLHGLFDHKSELEETVENSLKQAGLWDEVKDRLNVPGTALSGGQQQRLCIARTIAIKPEIVLMDEPCSALDPIATGKIEELITSLQKNYSIVIVTHSMSQAQRISKRTAFFDMGEIAEFGTTKQIFESPKNSRTKGYISGRWG